MQNYVQPGETLKFTNPYATALAAGAGALVGSVFGVCTSDIAIGAAGQMTTEGVFTLAKTSAQAWTDGQKVAWDDANKRCDNDLSKGPMIGVSVNGGAANPSATAAVRLNGIGNGRANSISWEGSLAPASYSTAGNVTYTAADLLGGVIVRATNGASRSDTLPTAAQIVAATPNAKVGDVIQCLLVNGASAAETITLNAGAGGAFDANQSAGSRIVAQNASKMVTVRLTNVTAAAEAYVVYA